MRFDATARQIRALLQLAEVDQRGPTTSEAGQRNRDALMGHLPQRLLDRYQLLREAGRTPVVVALDRGSCSGCHLRLPTMVESKARRSAAIHTCPHCQRMLYVREFVHGDSQVADDKSSERPTQAAAGRQP
jgi:predicted  nucleic acid-binding Zn-ribbon protein